MVVVVDAMAVVVAATVVGDVLAELTRVVVDSPANVVVAPVDVFAPELQAARNKVSRAPEARIIDRR